MTDEIVSFETAKLAKEKGFCIASYTGHGIRVYQRMGFLTSTLSNLIPCSKRIDAPTQSLLQRWLREKHSINLEINYSQCNWWMWVIIKESDYIHIEGTNATDDVNLSYEEVFEIGLQEALRLIK